MKASTPLSTSGATATFTSTALKPTAIRIVKGSSDPVEAKNSYIVSLLDTPVFHAVGVDSTGGRIGEVRSRWAIAASGPSAGSSTVEPVEKASQTTLRPSAIGKVTLSANPSMSGLKAGVADVLIGGLFVDVNNDFSASNLHSDLPLFVPGSTLDGESVPVPSSAESAIQKVKLHVLNKATTGSVTFTLSEVTSYRGIAMNYPIEDAATTPDLDFGTEADAGCFLRECITVPLAGSGDTSVTLYVRDYAAYGKLRMQIKVGKDSYEETISIPTDDATRNRIPDAGWKAAGQSVSSVGRLATEDSDGLPAADGDPLLGRLGDGLTAFEEYRGFVVSGVHTRTDPGKKDLFIVMDESLYNRRYLLSELPTINHFLTQDEVLGDMQPHLNFNFVPGLRVGTQRALRIRERSPAPLIYKGGTFFTVAAWGMYGYTFTEGDNLDLIELDLDGPNLSPNETLTADIFTETFGALITSGDDSVLQTSVAPGDFSGNVNGKDVIYAGSGGLQSTPCDLSPGCDDYQSDQVAPSCRGESGSHILTREEFLREQAINIVHEAAHGIDVKHDESDCSLSYMRFPGGFMPQASYFTPADISQIRIHRHH